MDELIKNFNEIKKIYNSEYLNNIFDEYILLNNIENKIVDAIKNNNENEIDNLFLYIIDNLLITKINIEKIKLYINNSKYINYLKIYSDLDKGIIPYEYLFNETEYYSIKINEIENFDLNAKNYFISLIYEFRYLRNRILQIKYLKLYPSLKSYIDLISICPKHSKFYAKKIMYLKYNFSKYNFLWYCDEKINNLLIKFNKYKYKFYCERWLSLGGKICEFPDKKEIYLKKIIIQQKEDINKIDYILFILKKKHLFF